MDRVLLFFLGLGLALTVRARIVTTIHSPDGDIIDCTHILFQPAFNHTLLQNHTLQETPKHLPHIAKNEDEVGSWQIWHKSASKCPEGTIPIRRFRINEEEIGTEIHEYAIGFMYTKPHTYGTKATVSVNHPKVDREEEFSLVQIWIFSGSYNNNDLNTMEVGWQVSRGLYSDSQPRLFLYWTTDAYMSTGCYNLRCPGFIQTSRSILIEGAITLTSTQPELTMQIWKDPILGHWWLSVSPTSSTGLIPVGYWPKEILTRFAHYAENIQWGGEIINYNVSGRHTGTEMGSGYFPNSTKAAYVRDIEIVVNKHDFQPVQNLSVTATCPAYYEVTKSSETSFTYGGPQQGEAVYFSVDTICVYFCLSLIFALLA